MCVTIRPVHTTEGERVSAKSFSGRPSGKVDENEDRIDSGFRVQRFAHHNIGVCLTMSEPVSLTVPGFSRGVVICHARLSLNVAVVLCPPARLYLLLPRRPHPPRRVTRSARFHLPLAGARCVVASTAAAADRPGHVSPAIFSR